MSIVDTMFRQPASSQVRSFSPAVIGIVTALLIGIGGAFGVSYALFQPVVFPSPLALSVREGATTEEISTTLRERGAIRSAILFRALAVFMYRGASLKAGDYTLMGSLNIPQAVQLFIGGMPRKEKTITVIEGWTVPAIGRFLEQAGITTARDFTAETNVDVTGAHPFLPPRTIATSVEGYLFPDTYRIFEDSTSEEIIRKMLDNFQTKYTPAMAEETLKRKRTVHEIVTLASILEWEVQNHADRRMVADVFFRRLAVGMPLQADSTINYITGRADDRARAVDLQIDSPYNTYRRKGLPPGPIGNPGLSALQAALTPIENPFWFFLTTMDGDVVYSKTFEEHVKNKLKFLK